VEFEFRRKYAAQAELVRSTGKKQRLANKVGGICPCSFEKHNYKRQRFCCKASGSWKSACRMGIPAHREPEDGQECPSYRGRKFPPLAQGKRPADTLPT
jgi:hypothetical protein